MVNLYHATPRPFSRKILEARSDREINGQQGPFAFASDDKRHALTYTLTKGVRLANQHIDETNMQILFIDKESIIAEPELTGGIYSFASDNFEQAIFDGSPSNQWVSRQNTNLEMAKYTPIESLNDLMKEKIQIFQIGEHDSFNAYDLYKLTIDKSVHFLEEVQDKLDQGQIKWVNSEREINPIVPFPAQNHTICTTPINKTFISLS